MRSVIVVGTCGASGSGKTTLTKDLAEHFDSPIKPISADDYFKSRENKPMCCYGGRHKCSEMPQSVDQVALAHDLQKLVDELRISQRMPSVSMNQKCVDRRGLVGKKLGGAQIVIFVEGFVLLAEPLLVELCDHILWLDCDESTACERRFCRRKKAKPASSDAAFIEFKSFYRHVYRHHADLRAQFEEAMATRPYTRLDARRPLEEVRNVALQSLENALAEVSEGSQQKSTLASAGTRRIWRNHRSAARQEDISERRGWDLPVPRKSLENGYCNSSRPMTRKEIALETMEVLEAATSKSSEIDALPEALRNIDGRQTFSEMVSSAVACSMWFPEEDGRRAIPKREADVAHFDVEFVRETTLACIYNQQGQGHIAALNFASATNPGGGFLGGAQAQEESLARSSALFPCLDKFRDSHYALPLRGSCYTHSMIFSRHVPFFREDDGTIRAPVCCSVITSPACNMKRISGSESNAEARTIMKERMRRIFHLAAAEHVDVLILGAWGCGVFGGSPEQIAEDFRQVARDTKFRHIRCVFAIPCSVTLGTFRRVFDEGGAARQFVCQPQSSQSERRWKGRSHRERRVRDDYEVAAENFSSIC